MTETYQPAELPALLSPSQAADLLGVKPQTLAVWRSTKRYPLAFVKVGNAVRYRSCDLARFLESRTVDCVAK